MHTADLGDRQMISWVTSFRLGIKTPRRLNVSISYILVGDDFMA